MGKLTETQKVEIRELVKLGFGIDFVAKKVGCIRGTVNSFCILEGITSYARLKREKPPVITRKECKRGKHFVRQFSATDDETIRIMQKQGKTMAEIARTLKRNPSSINARLAVFARDKEKP